MKIMVFSDIHGSLYYTKKVIERIEKEAPDRIMILGDVLYHGPRNPLPKDYDPLEVVKLLNPYVDKTIGVRGNCDAEIDVQLLGYGGSKDTLQLTFNDRPFFMTHGHIYHPDDHPILDKGTVFLYGHTHIYQAESKDGIYYFNPGSVSIPKGGNLHSYGMIDNDELVVKDLDGNVLTRCRLQDDR